MSPAKKSVASAEVSPVQVGKPMPDVGLGQRAGSFWTESREVSSAPPTAVRPPRRLQAVLAEVFLDTLMAPLLLF